MKLDVVDLTTAGGYSHALRVWTASSHREPHAHPAYALAFAGSGEIVAHCAIAESEQGSILLPFGVRPVPLGASASGADAVTPYGYGGAYICGCADAQTFWRLFDEATPNLISLTIRRNVAAAPILPPRGQTLTVLHNVVVDTSRPPSELWDSYQGRVRTDCRRAEREGVSVSADPLCEGLADFHRVYTQTMADKGADPYYYFSLEQLTHLVEAMPGSVCLFHARLGDEVIASEMQLLGAQRAYYFLSGALPAARRASANPFMKHAVITWLHEQGIQSYILGGGMRADDSLLRYKRAFAPQGIVDFEIEYLELDPAGAARALAWRQLQTPGWQPPPDFLPGYRAPEVSHEKP